MCSEYLCNLYFFELYIIYMKELTILIALLVVTFRLVKSKSKGGLL